MGVWRYRLAGMHRENDRERHHWTEEDARRELDGWYRSGESMTAYARGRGYSPQRLRWWQKRLAPSTAAMEARPIALAPAVLTGSAAALVISLSPGEVRVEVDAPEALEPAWLANLACALREGMTR